MSEKETTTTPDPELYLPPLNEDGLPSVSDNPLTDNPRGEVPGCPTGLTNALPAQQQGDSGVTGNPKKKDSER